MVELTVNVPDKLAARIGATGVWFPTIIELGLIGIKSSMTAQASGALVEFLSFNPTPHDVLGYFLEEKYQERLDYLLDLNGEGELDEFEEAELSEWNRLNHVSILLKASAAKLLKSRS